MPKLTHKATIDNQKRKKKLLVKKYTEHLGNVMEATKSLGLERTVFYRWYERDEKFRNEIDNVNWKDMLVDEAQNSLLQLIRERNVPSVLFTLKTIGRPRGFIEHPENTLAFTLNQQNNNITIDNLLVAIQKSEREKEKLLEGISFE